MTKLYSYLLVIIAMGLTSCKMNSTDKSSAIVDQKNSTSELMSLDSPNIPVILTTPEDRGGFLAKHYWDNLNFVDTNITYNKDMLEQKWVDYIDILSHFAQNNSAELLKDFYGAVQQNDKLYPYFTELADKYLYSKESPLQNDVFLVPILETMLVKEGLSSVEIEQIQFKLNITSKNNPGSVAQDFSYSKLEGGIGQLSKLKKEYTLVFLFNPECHFCLRDAKILAESALITDLIKTKKMDLVAICVEEGIDTWKEHISDWPKSWIHGYDTNQDITNEQLYDLRAFPTFYLLDKDKKVILKDRPVEEVINVLSHL